MRLPSVSPWCIGIIVALTAGDADAGPVPVPTEIKALIVANCPGCGESGVTACGTADVAFGKRLARNFFSGKPKRGYLPGHVMTGAEFRVLARRLAHDALVAELRRRFAATPLVVVEGKFAAVRALAAPAVEIVFPEPLHQCLMDQARPWGCCIAADCAQECCEKALGSPSVTLRWSDQVALETVTFHFSHTLGSSTLTRTAADGSNTLYWCLTDEAGELR